MQTKIVVATSVLSKRWRPLWRSVPTVDLDDAAYVDNKEPYLHFVHLAYAAMPSRDVTQPILTFRLKCAPSFFRDPHDIKLCVDAAIRHEVETVELSLPSTIELPSVILTCTSLVVLKLRELAADGISNVCLPVLQILHLDGNYSDWSGLDFENQLYTQAVPKCLSSPLRACSLLNFQGADNDLQFARYIMQNARVLRTMTIRSTASLNTEAKFQILKNL